MPNQVKSWKIWYKVEFFALFGMELQKNAKMGKTPHEFDVLIQKTIQN